LLNNLLIYRLIIVNAIATVLLGVAYYKGWVAIVLEGDSTNLVYAMVGLFAVFMLSLATKAAKVSAHLNRTKTHPSGPKVNATKFLEKMAHLDDIPNWLVTLGLLGTVIGIMISISAIDKDAMLTADGVRASVAQLMNGMQVAFCTTIVGGVLALWCDINRRMLKTAAVLMIEDQKWAPRP
jgi:uncharacterized membrane protein YuzA (DUF378 family)